MDEDEVIAYVDRKTEYALKHEFGYVSHYDLLNGFALDSGVDEEGLHNSDFDSIVAMRMRQLGWVETEKCDGYELVKPAELETPVDHERLRRDSALVQMLGIDAGAHDWDF